MFGSHSHVDIDAFSYSVNLNLGYLQLLPNPYHDI